MGDQIKTVSLLNGMKKVLEFIKAIGGALIGCAVWLIVIMLVSFILAIPVLILLFLDWV